MTEGKVPVTLRSVLQRLNRALAKDVRLLKKSRIGPIRRAFGLYYIVDLRSNRVEDTPEARHVDPVALAHRLGVLAEWEELSEEKSDV